MDVVFDALNFNDSVFDGGLILEGEGYFVEGVDVFDGFLVRLVGAVEVTVFEGSFGLVVMEGDTFYLEGMKGDGVLGVSGVIFDKGRQALFGIVGIRQFGEVIGLQGVTHVGGFDLGEFVEGAIGFIEVSSFGVCFVKDFKVFGIGIFFGFNLIFDGLEFCSGEG